MAKKIEPAHIAKRLLQTILFPFNLANATLDFALRENPYETELSHIADCIDLHRIVYKNRELNLEKFEEEVKKFDKIYKLNYRWQFIPAGGDIIPHTRKEVSRDINPEQAWSFISENMLPKSASPYLNSKVLVPEKFHALGRYFATLRNCSQDNWLHVYSPSNCALVWELVDIVGRRR